MFHIKHLEKYLYTFLFCLLFFIPFSVFAADTAPLKTDIWRSGIGEGFRDGTGVLGLSAGATYGVGLGSEEQHNLALISVSYGRMIGNVKGEGKWYRGNWELRAELFGGADVYSKNHAIVGLTPHLRYNFATGTRFSPYVDVGIGVSLTETREPDLGGSFQFNDQAIIGANYFVKDNLGINIAIQYLHVSSAGISNPNKGINTVGCFLGVNWFF